MGLIPVYQKQRCCFERLLPKKLTDAYRPTSAGQALSLQSSLLLSES